jgi:asparagine synthase (glutamine-hydrolysing)
MSGLAVAVDWERAEGGTEAVRRMLAAMPHRSPDGASVAAAPHAALGLGLRATTARERGAAQPLHDPAAGLWLVADARIDNRDEVARALYLPATPASDAELLLRGLVRMGAALASRLEGDFAFAAWDERRRVLVASRDAMGLRPLFWRAAGRGLLLASEVDALLDAGGEAEVEPAAVLDFLRHRTGPASRTFFHGIQRLPPGHVIEAGEGGVRDLGHARPPPLRPEPPPRGEDVPGFRRRLRAAVACRLESDGPVVLALSGGLDSGAIACMAEDLHREDPRGRAPLVLASAVFRGFAADETPFLEAVLSRVRFRCERWDASAAPPAAPEPFPRAHPVRDPMTGGALSALEVARAAGSRVLLMGLGGDELLLEAGVLEDLARHGRLVTLARETLGGRPYTATPGPRLLADAVRAAAPSWGRRALRAALPRRAVPPPAWLGPALRSLWPPPDPPRPEPVPSRVQADVRGLLTGEDLFFAVEVAELAAARAGLQLRLPFLDRSLVEWVHSIPWERRLPRGLMKRLLRDAMAGLWPERLARRREVALAGDYLAWSIRRAVPLLAPTVEGLRWEAEEFIVHGEAKRLLESLPDTRSVSAWWRWMEVWDTVCLESWLREARGR